MQQKFIYSCETKQDVFNEDLKEKSLKTRNHEFIPKDTKLVINSLIQCSYGIFYEVYYKGKFWWINPFYTQNFKLHKIITTMEINGKKVIELEDVKEIKI